MPIDYQNDLGVTLLHVAAQNGNKRIAKLCLRKGADVNKRNNNGQVCTKNVPCQSHSAYTHGEDQTSSPTHCSTLCIRVCVGGYRSQMVVRVDDYAPGGVSYSSMFCALFSVGTHIIRGKLPINCWRKVNQIRNQR